MEICLIIMKHVIVLKSWTIYGHTVELELQPPKSNQFIFESN